MTEHKGPINPFEDRASNLLFDARAKLAEVEKGDSYATSLGDFLDYQGAKFAHRFNRKFNEEYALGKVNLIGGSGNPHVDQMGFEATLRVSEAELVATRERIRARITADPTYEKHYLDWERLAGELQLMHMRRVELGMGVPHLHLDKEKRDEVTGKAAVDMTELFKGYKLRFTPKIKDWMSMEVWD